MNTRCCLLVAIAILIAFAFYFHSAKEHVFRSLLHERVAAIKNDVDYVCDMVDYLVVEDGGWCVEKYRDSLAFLTERIDATPNVYAELMDGSFSAISNRVIPEGDSWWFDPRQCPDLMALLQSENTGNYSVMCPENGMPLEVHLHWRWIPTCGQHENRVLLIVGVTQYSVNTRIEDRFIYGIIALFFTSAVFVIGSMMLLTVEYRKRRRGND